MLLFYTVMSVAVRHLSWAFKHISCPIASADGRDKHLAKTSEIHVSSKAWSSLISIVPAVASSNCLSMVGTGYEPLFLQEAREQA